MKGSGKHRAIVGSGHHHHQAEVTAKDVLTGGAAIPALIDGDIVGPGLAILVAAVSGLIATWLDQ